MSTPTAPSASWTAITAARIEASSHTSSASVLHPREARSAIDSTLRAVAYTFHPRDASRSAVARPIPVEHPVIRTAFDIDSAICMLRGFRFHFFHWSGLRPHKLLDSSGRERRGVQDDPPRKSGGNRDGRQRAQI